jgi:hypothetical protein
MAILNYSDITKAIESILRQKLKGYVITRNERKNTDPNVCLIAGTGWIGIYRGSIDYSAYVISSRPWLVDPAPIVNVQVVSKLSGSDAEDRLQAAEEEVVNALDADRSLKNTVSTVLGYSMEYDYNSTNEIYFHGVNIKIKAQTRS